MSEGRLLNKYKDLALYDPYDEVTHTVYSRNLTYVKKVLWEKEFKEWMGYSRYTP